LQRWETLPGIFWSFPSDEPKPTANVLVEHSDPTLKKVVGSRPLLVSGRYGAGQVLYLGFNGTWRWRKAGRQAEFFDKFWIQAVRYLVEGRSLEGRRRGYVNGTRSISHSADQASIMRGWNTAKPMKPRWSIDCATPPLRSVTRSLCARARCRSCRS
jgi:hypothetical protein